MIYLGRIGWCSLKFVENVITLGKLIGQLFLFCLPPPLYFVFEKLRGTTSLAL